MWKCLGGRSILFHVSREAVRALNARLFSSENCSDKKHRNADYPSLNEPLLPPAVCGSAGLGWNRLVIRWGQLAALHTDTVMYNQSERVTQSDVQLSESRILKQRKVAAAAMRGEKKTEAATFAGKGNFGRNSPRRSIAEERPMAKIGGNWSTEIRFSLWHPVSQ